jgi:hypothetical protein
VAVVGVKIHHNLVIQRDSLGDLVAVEEVQEDLQEVVIHLQLLHLKD